jgi:hypothetical protein
MKVAKPTNPASEQSTNADNSIQYPVGQRLRCSKCDSEIEIINPCTCNPPDQVLRCCGQDMTPTIGRNIHLGVE